MRPVLLASVAALSLALAAPGSTQTVTGTPDEALPSAPQSGPVGTTLPEDLLGRDIVDITGNDVGTVDDVVVDSQGKASLMMVDVGGFLGIGSRTVALDAATITLEQEGDLVSSLTREQIELLPAYEQSDGGWQVVK
jgi:hypothetical protein